VSIYTAGRLFFFVIYLFTRPVENNYDNYIDHAHAVFLSFCYALKRLSPFFLYIATKNPLFNDKVCTYYRCRRNACKNITVSVPVRVSVTVRVSLV